VTARDIINEIAAVRGRRLLDSTTGELSIRLYALEASLRALGASKNETIRYFPVAIVACMEGMVRAAIKDMIDAGSPYTERAERLASKLRLDYSLIAALQGKRVTVGEFVAHGVPISRLEHIDGAVSELMGSSFLEGLRTVADRWAHGSNKAPLLTEPDRIFSDVRRTIELRHIVCHELATAYVFDNEEIERCFDSCVRFLRAADELIFQTVYPDAPLTQPDLNEAAGAQLSADEAQLAEVIESIAARLDAEARADFEGIQTAWRGYRDAWVHFVVGERENGGTIWPLLYLSEMSAITRRRTSELEAYNASWNNV